MSLFNKEKILVSTEELFALHRGIAEATEHDPVIGLKLGADERVEHYDPNKIAALAARSFRDSIERLSRYKRLTCPEEILLIDREDECVILFAWLLANEPEPPLLVDVCFAWIVALGQRGTGRPLHARGWSFSERQATDRHTRNTSVAG